MRLAHVCSLAGILCVLGVVPAAAQEVLRQRGALSSRDEFNAAMTALKAGDAERAARLFERVYARTKVPIALYGLGQALYRLGRYDEAADALEGYAASADPERNAPRIERARRIARELRARGGGSCPRGDPCFGPYASLGFPRLLGIGLELRVSRHVALEAGVVWTPSVRYEIVEAEARTFQAKLRLHPLGNVLFVSAGIAYEHVEGQVTRKKVPVSGEVDVASLLFGVGVAGGRGFVLGFESGMVVDIARSDVKLRTDIEVPASVDKDALLGRVASDFEAARSSFPFLFQATLRAGLLF